MSSSLLWRPVAPPSGHHLSTGLKFLFRELQDGDNVDRVLTEDDVSWLEVMKVGRDQETKAEIDELIKALERHGSIHLYEEW